jgi:hypothetical protein
MRWLLAILSILGGVLVTPVGLFLAYVKLMHFWRGLGQMHDFMAFLDVVGDFLSLALLLLGTLVIAGNLILKGIEWFEGPQATSDTDKTPVPPEG